MIFHSRLTPNPLEPKAFKAWISAVGYRLLAIFFVVFLFAGCKSKSKLTGPNLPSPPSADSGIYDGQFIQTDYGFGFPMPSKWLWLRLSAEQEVDEVVRFCDISRDMIVRVSVQLTGADSSFSDKDWVSDAGQDLINHQYKIKKNDGALEWKTGDSSRWIEVPFHITDSRGDEWMDQEWALKKGDLLIGVHALVPQDEADTEKGKKFLNQLQGALTQIHWYMPIGPRGISIDRFELQHFTEGFCRALESRSSTRIGAYFDEMYPDRTKWNNWYQQAVNGDPQSIELKAELSGLVINGDNATASFTMTRKDKSNPRPQKFERNFKLSKKEGTWKIIISLDKN